MTTYKPRNDFCLVRIINVGKERGILMPDMALQGKVHVVEAIGPKVTGLKVGDHVLMIGTPGEDYGKLPNENDLVVIKEANIILIMGHSDAIYPDGDKS